MNLCGHTYLHFTLLGEGGISSLEDELNAANGTTTVYLTLKIISLSLISCIKE